MEVACTESAGSSANGDVAGLKMNSDAHIPTHPKRSDENTRPVGNNGVVCVCIHMSSKGPGVDERIVYNIVHYNVISNHQQL